MDIDVQSVEVEGKAVEVISYMHVLQEFQLQYLLYSFKIIFRTFKFFLVDKNPVMGSALRISLPSKAHAGDKVTVKVTYNVGSEAFALQFLDKE